MGDRLGILRVVSSFFSSGIVLFLLKNIELKEKYILFKRTCSRPYRLENTRSRPITAVKLDLAELVLGWETALEYFVSWDVFFRAILLFFYKISNSYRSIFFSSTHVHDHTVWKIPVLVRSPQLN